MKSGLKKVTSTAAIFLPLLLSAVSYGEVRLITGDANNAIHSRDSFLMDLSADGDLVLFSSGPPTTGSTPGITTGGLYRRKLSTGELSYVGDTSTAGGVGGYADMSDDGRYITWSTLPDNYVYWRDNQAGVTRQLTPTASTNSGRPYISGDGRYVVFSSFARNLVTDTSKLPASGRAAIYLYDSVGQTTVVASLTESGAALNTGVGIPSGPSLVPNEFHFSGNGRYIVFSSDATNFTSRPSNFSSGFPCIYRRDLQTGAVVLVNRNSAGSVSDGNYSGPRVSADGNRVVFTGGYSGQFGGKVQMTTAAPLAFGSELYVKEVSSGNVWWATRTTTGAAQNGIALGAQLAISGNGNVVSFSSDATNHVTENTDVGGGGGGSIDIFRVDLGTAGATTTTLITKSPNNSGNVSFYTGPFLPGTGDYVAFCTTQLEAVFGTGNGSSVFLHGVAVGTVPAVVPTYLSFSSWAAALPAGQRGYQDNPSGDGVRNLEKYFLGANAAVADLSKRPVRSSAPGSALGLAGNSNAYLTLQFRVRRGLPPGFSWQVNASDNLVDLSTAGGAVQVGTPVADGDFDVYLFRYPTPMTGKGFMNVTFTGS